MLAAVAGRPGSFGTFLTSPPEPYFDSAACWRGNGTPRWTLRALAGEVRSIGPGWLARTPSLPGVWTLNQFRITAPAAAAEIVATAEEHQADLPYRHIVVDTAPRPTSWRQRWRPRIWHAQREVVMVLVAKPDREVDTGAVTELTEGQVLALMRRSVAEDTDIAASGLDQLEAYNRLRGGCGTSAVSGRPRCARGRHELRQYGTTAWVEDVYTVPEERGKGHARRLVTHATALARSVGHDLTFIIADDNDWPKYLYAKIGFRAVGTTFTFHRAAGALRAKKA